MAPSRTGGAKGGGAYQIDRVIPGVGRIKRTSGATTKAEYERRNALLTKLAETASLDVLIAFRDGHVTMGELVEADRGRKGALALDRVALTKGLWAAIDDALPRMGKSAETRDRYHRSLAKLKAVADWPAHPRVGALADVDWAALAAAWPDSATDWNHLRRAVSRFLTIHLKDKYHPVRRAIVSAIPAKKEHPRAPDISPELFLRLLATMTRGEEVEFMTLALTGMRIGEYVTADEGALRPETRSVAVDGKSGPGIVYLTPEGYAIAAEAILCPLAPPPLPGQFTNKTLRYGRMRRALRRAQRACGVKGLRLHDVRHLFGQTSADAGVPTAETQAQLRHQDPSTTRIYEILAQARRAAQAVAARLGITSSAPISSPSPNRRPA